jgi:L-asparaginase/Glu-tRNA(Gln) amidotransferase subunit D
MMQQVKLRSHVGEDGILHLDIPVEVKETDLEVTVTVKPTSSIDNATTQKRTHVESRRIFEKIQQLYSGRTFSDSTNLLREDRQR